MTAAPAPDPGPPRRVARSIYRTKQPCEVCASDQSRPYLTGWLCDNHSPSAMRERTK